MLSSGEIVVSGEVAGGLAAVLAVFLIMNFVLLVVIAFLMQRKMSKCMLSLRSITMR